MLEAYDLWQKHDTEQEEKLSKLPTCCYCGEKIQQEKAVFFGGWWCEDCEDELWQSVRKEFLKEVREWKSF